MHWFITMIHFSHPFWFEAVLSGIQAICLLVLGTFLPYDSIDEEIGNHFYPLTYRNAYLRQRFGTLLPLSLMAVDFLEILRGFCFVTSCGGRFLSSKIVDEELRGNLAILVQRSTCL